MFSLFKAKFILSCGNDVCISGSSFYSLPCIVSAVKGVWHFFSAFSSKMKTVGINVSL